MSVYIPENYNSLLSIYDTQKSIGLLHRIFEDNLAANLNLNRVSAPLFVRKDSGINDNLNGYERPVEFEILHADGTAQIVHSLAKWKRLALKRYNFFPGKGLYTDMNAVRRDEEILDNLHSVYVDQWDWEKVILPSDRNLDYLKSTVMDIVRALSDTQKTMKSIYPALNRVPDISTEVSFITSQELEDMYPDLTPKEREDAITEEKRAVFIMKIGDVLKSGEKHDGRAPDYDDWELNGDIILWDEVLDRAVELSSMGIRVDAEAMDRQLKKAGLEERRELDFHKMILNDELPYTIGGGIGQSRLCMFFLRKAHIGEVQVSVWPEEMYDECAKHNIFLL